MRCWRGRRILPLLWTRKLGSGLADVNSKSLLSNTMLRGTHAMLARQADITPGRRPAARGMWTLTMWRLHIRSRWSRPRRRDGELPNKCSMHNVSGTACCLAWPAGNACKC